MQNFTTSLALLIMVPSFIIHELSHIVFYALCALFGNVFSFKVEKLAVNIFTHRRLSMHITYRALYTRSGQLGIMFVSISPLFSYIGIVLYSLATLNLWIIIYIFCEAFVGMLFTQEEDSAFLPSPLDFQAVYEAYKNYKTLEP